MTMRSGPSNEENVVMAAKTRRGKKSSSQKNFHKNFQKDKFKGTFKGKGFDMSKVKCFNCNKMGHFAKDCRYKKKDYHKGKHHASTVEEEESGKKTSGSPKKQENRKEYYFVSALSGHLTTD
jgi:hypothetical protein